MHINAARVGGIRVVLQATVCRWGGMAQLGRPPPFPAVPPDIPLAASFAPRLRLSVK